jgi:hypothetical protein
MKENEIRDKLVANLQIINEDYQFLNKEKYLPNEIGTKSFIDIFAKRSNGKYVIIEIKRSDAASREAIHELFKYLEAVKKNLSCNSDEIELVVVSTEWDELLVPFSSFISHIDLNVFGYKLTVDESKIKPLVLTEDRILSAIQMARYYITPKSLSAGIQAHIDFFESHKVKSFVILILKSPENYREMVINSIKAFELENFGEIKLDESKIPDYKFMVYSTNQLLTEVEYLAFLKDGEYQDSIDEIIENSKSTLLDKLESLNELLIETEPFPDSDYVEIGTPAKYMKFIQEEGWELLEIKKYGSLSDNVLLSDEIIEQEILGCSGTTGQHFKASFDLQDNASLARIKREISNCLSDNIIWKNHIFEIIEILRQEGIKDIYCSVYNPMNIVYSIYLISCHENGVLYIPSYQIQFTSNNEKRMYLGYLDGTIKDVDLKNVFNTHYENGESEFMYSLTWGGYSSKNVEMTQFIGLDYRTMFVSVVDEKKRFYKYTNYRFTETSTFNPIIDFLYQLSENKTLVPEIIQYFTEHSLGNGVYSW